MEYLIFCRDDVEVYSFVVAASSYDDLMAHLNFELELTPDTYIFSIEKIACERLAS